MSVGAGGGGVVPPFLIFFTYEGHPVVLPDHAHPGADDAVRLLPHNHRVTWEGRIVKIKLFFTFFIGCSCSCSFYWLFLFFLVVLVLVISLVALVLFIGFIVQHKGLHN